MKSCYICAILILALIMLLSNCTHNSDKSVELKSYTLDSLDGLITGDNITLDKKVSSDGNGAIKIETSEAAVVRLFEIGDIDIEDSQLIYRANLKTENFEGKVYLEMRCNFLGKGEFFSKGLHCILSGTADWTTVETPFYLQKGQNPDTVKLNLVANGSGTVWIDDIKLLRISL